MGAAICRELPYADADGPANMATDEVLLEGALAGAASFRLYGWAGPTVSLGYFQPSGLREADPLLAELPFVRRPSGGGALVHHHEITYCLALPAGPAWQPRGQSWICRMHAVIADALASLGVRIRTVACGEERVLGDRLCFQNQTAGDLLCEGHKVVGSAQRRQRGALMQHGSVLLARSPFAPELPGLNELAGTELRPEVLGAAVRSALGRSCDWEIEKSGWSASALARIRALKDEKFAQDAWNRKR